MIGLKQLLNQFPFSGTVEWIGVRPQRDAVMLEPVQTIASVSSGLEGDRFHGTTTNKRQVTLIQAEHLRIIATFLQQDVIHPAMVRRNLVISGINLLALKNRRFLVGEAVLEMTGLCHPCSKMEFYLGKGAYNAMRGHGGITAKVVQNGIIRLGDRVFPVND